MQMPSNNTEQELDPIVEVCCTVLMIAVILMLPNLDCFNHN